MMIQVIFRTMMILKWCDISIYDKMGHDLKLSKDECTKSLKYAKYCQVLYESRSYISNIKEIVIRQNPKIRNSNIA
jgi:hypothetical protein